MTLTSTPGKLKALALLAMPVLLASLAGCGVGEASSAAEPGEAPVAPVPVVVAAALRTDLFATYETTATLASDRDAPVPARVAGEVVEIAVEEGMPVEAGDVLARLDGERLELEMLVAKADLERVRGEYRRYTDLHARNLVSASMFDGLKYDLEALEAVYERRKLEYEYATIRAPIAGMVSSRDIRLGQTLAPGAVTFRITGTTELRADLYIPQSELPKFSAGHSATLAVDSMPGRTFSAEIARISPTIDRTDGTFRATALIDNPNDLLAPGMFARFSIAWEKHENALVVPRTALVEEDGRMLVYVVENGRVERRVVDTGIVSGELVEILGGLGEAEPVVIVGHGSLKDGSRVLASAGERWVG